MAISKSVWRRRAQEKSRVRPSFLLFSGFHIGYAFLQFIVKCFWQYGTVSLKQFYCPQRLLVHFGSYDLVGVELSGTDRSTYQDQFSWPNWSLQGSEISMQIGMERNLICTSFFWICLMSNKQVSWLLRIFSFYSENNRIANVLACSWARTARLGGVQL